ncbi:hypothetical protein [Nocardia sp. NBC_01009]|uniref:hypothetical protein n=1 Tax=Nocardia sp. NBC_01009 TaxID=2975996 RepID=UPI00386A639F|nr:hypothetical protein OHA42_15650 [Nocardia sp. NBC_01009]
MPDLPAASLPKRLGLSWRSLRRITPPIPTARTFVADRGSAQWRDAPVVRDNTVLALLPEWPSLGFAFVPWLRIDNIAEVNVHG